MEFRPLSRERFQGYLLQVRYTTSRIYEVALLERGFALREKHLPAPIAKSWEDRLFGDWLEEPVAFGCYDGATLLGIVEGSVENWHNLFRISNLFVEEDFRGQGIGGFLLNGMMEWAEAHTSCRGIILETQTCNYPAICLYEKMGFRLCRIDTHEYSDRDVEQNEVRVDLICPIRRIIT